MCWVAVAFRFSTLRTRLERNHRALFEAHGAYMSLHASQPARLFGADGKYGKRAISATHVPLLYYFIIARAEVCQGV
jgi:hypothetical protein